MRKHNLFRFCLLLIMAVAGFVASAADTGVIYLVDWGRTSGGAPLKDNEADFTKLYETEPGSRVYTGDHNFMSLNWFRFYSELQEGPEVNWKLGNICPMADNTMTTRVGKSGIYFDSNVHDTKLLSPYEEAGVWVLPAAGNYRVTVDLNACTLELIPENDLLVSFGNDARPGPDNYADFYALSTLNEYVEGGDLNIYFYSPYNKAWYNPDEAMKPEYSYSEFCTAVFGDLNTDQAVSFEVKDWPGGIIYNKYDRLYFYPDKGWNPGTITAEKIYIAGSANGWIHAECSTPADDSGMVFNVTIPAGMEEFKFCLTPSWEYNYGQGTVTKNAAGEYVVQLVPDAYNFQFHTALDAPMEGVFNLKDMTLTLPATAPLTASTPVDYSNCLFLSTPDDDFEIWDTAPSTVLSSYTRLYPQGENTWSTEMYVPADDFRFNFISNLTAKGQPNVKLAPASGTDVALNYIDGYAYASASPQPEGEAAWWTINNLNLQSMVGHKVTLTVTRQGDRYTLKVDDLSFDKGSKIYLVGSPTYWDINNDEIQLLSTDRGGYYGSFTATAGENYFRFYTELGDWGNDGQLPSIGANSLDGETLNVPFDGYYSGPCVPGKGSWNIRTSTGGTIYLYVDLNAWQVIFSSSPIEEAGNVIDPSAWVRNPVKEGLFMSLDGGGKVEIEATAEGVYTYRPSYIPAGSRTMHFFTRQLPITMAEPEWAGSYTVGLKGNGVADFTAGNHAEFDLEINDVVGTEPATPLTMILDDDVWSHYGEIVIDLNKKKLYAADFKRLALVMAGEELPSATDASRYDGLLLGEHGGIVNIPAGKFDFRFYRPGYPETVEETVNLSFADDPFVYANTGSFNGWDYSRLTATDWHGGPLFISTSMAYDLSQLHSISAVTWNGSEYVTTPMAETAPGSLLYKGTVNLTTEGADYGYPTAHSFYFLLAEKNAVITYPYGETESHLEIILGSPYMIMSGAGVTSDPKKQDLYFNGNSAASPVFFRGNPFHIANIAGDAKVELTLDLNTLTMNATVVEGSAATGLETVGNASSPLDGALSYINTFSPSTSFIDVTAVTARAGGYDFNLITDRSTAIVPASGATTVIRFDDSGTWRGSYSEVPSPAAADAPDAMKRVVLRNSATQLAQWHFDVPEGDATDLAIAVDESTRTMTIHSLAHNKGFFIAAAGTVPRVDKLSDFPMLRPVETEGLYVGHFELTEPSGDYGSILFLSQPHTKATDRNGACGIMPDFYSGSRLDLTSTDPAIVPAWHEYTRDGETYRAPCYGFGFNAGAGKYEVLYDSLGNTISVSTHITGIDDVTADGFTATRLTVTPGAGCVTVTAPEETRVDFYSVSGVLVKSAVVPVGTTTVTIAPGFYITSGNKIVVR